MKDNPFRFFSMTDLDELHKIFCSSARYNKRSKRLHDELLEEVGLQREAKEAVDREDEKDV